MNKEKKQIDFTFKEAKEVAINHLLILAEFMENLHDAVPNKFPIEWAFNLRSLGLKVQQSHTPCLTENDVGQVLDLAYQVTHATQIQLYS